VERVKGKFSGATGALIAERYRASRGFAKIVIHGPRFLLGKGASFTRRKCIVLSPITDPKSSVGHTGRHCSRTAVAAFL
jgi:hypothetical protein